MIVALGLALGTIAAEALHPVARDTAEPVIIELALGRLASRTVTGYRFASAALLPLTQVLELAEIRVRAAGPRSLDAVIEPAGVTLRLDVDQRRLEAGRMVVPLLETELVLRDGEYYVASAPLGRALGLEWTVSWPDLTVTAIDPAELPIARRVERDWRRRSRVDGGDAALTVFRLGDGPRRAVDGLVVDYSIFAPTGQLDQAAYSTGLGLDLLGGSFTAVVQNQSDPGHHRLRADVAWSTVWKDRPWLTQARVGDAIASGPRPRTVRGVTFGNAPFLRPNQVGEVAFTGDLGPGWQVEAYRGGRLIGFDSVNALGRFSIDAPIAYGENPVELVAYGPFGELRRFHQTHRVESNRLPARRLEYAVSAGGCRTDRCTGTANLDVRYGVATRWTVQAGVDQFWRRDSLGNLFHPYLAAFGTLGNAVGVQAEVVANAIARGGVRYEPSTNLIVTAEATRFARGIRAPLLTPEGRTSQYTVAGLYRPDDRFAAFYLDGSLDFITTGTGTIASGRLGASYQYREVQLLPGVRWYRGGGAGASRTTFEVASYLLPLPQLGSFFGQLTARSFLEVEGSLRPAAANLFASRNLNREVRVEIGGGWGRDQGTTVAVNVAFNLATVRGLASVSHSAAGTVASQYAQGSILYHREARRLHLAAGPALERAGITGRVFLDSNGNEQFDPGEEPLPNVRVRVGMETRLSDNRGEYRLWNVTPYEAAIIAVDSATLASPLWVPARGAVAVEPTPNRFRIVDLPIAPGGVIDGRVIRAADSTGLAGVRLRLESLATGQTRTIVTFGDGGFYAMGIKPGTYLLTIDPATADRLGLAMETGPIRFTLPSSPDGATVSGLEVKLR